VRPTLGIPEHSKRMHHMSVPECDDDGDPLVGLRAMAEFATSEGFQISHSSMQKFCSPAISTGPEITGYWGKLPTSTKGRVRSWIRSRMRPVRQVEQSNQEELSV
jgi:hypothetical protein